MGFSSKIVLFSLLIIFVLSNFSLVSATPTTSSIQVKPNPVGLEQSVLVCLRVEPSPTEAGIAGWEGITVLVTRPTGSTTTIEISATDSTGVAYFNFVPDMVGHWTFQMSFPGQTVSGTEYDPSESTEEGLDVQPDPVEYQPEDLTCDILEEEDPCLFWKILVIILIIIILILLRLLLRGR
jgi:hypothetical protein